VPLIVCWPGVTPSGSVCDVPVHGLDWYPTLLGVAGVKPEATQPMDGVDIEGLLINPAGKRESAMYWHYPLKKPHFLGGRSAGAMRDGDWKLIEFFDTGELELYNLATDEGEQKNLAKEMPEKLEAMHDRLKAWRASTGAEVPTR
jgi:arylsulfatase A